MMQEKTIEEGLDKTSFENPENSTHLEYLEGQVSDEPHNEVEECFYDWLRPVLGF